MSSLTKFRKLRLTDENILDILIRKSVEIAIEKGVIKSKTSIVDATHTKSRYNRLKPVFYANFFPFFTAILTGIILLLSVIGLFKKLRATRLQNAIFICSVFALIFSVFPGILFGADYMSIVGVSITVLLLMSAVFQAFSNRTVGAKKQPT